MTPGIFCSNSTHQSCFLLGLAQKKKLLVIETHCSSIKFMNIQIYINRLMSINIINQGYFLSLLLSQSLLPNSLLKLKGVFWREVELGRHDMFRPDSSHFLFSCTSHEARLYWQKMNNVSEGEITPRQKKVKLIVFQYDLILKSEM